MTVEQMVEELYRIRAELWRMRMGLAGEARRWAGQAEENINRAVFYLALLQRALERRKDGEAVVVDGDRRGSGGVG
ncbi:MAG: hypothetical protein QXQ53_03750 [Candidatus Methanosuratincola sp.]